jgi:hypothetical protein
VDPVTGETLAPLHHEELPRNPVAAPTAEVQDENETLVGI